VCVCVCARFCDWQCVAVCCRAAYLLTAVDIGANAQETLHLPYLAVFSCRKEQLFLCVCVIDCVGVSVDLSVWVCVYLLEGGCKRVCVRENFILAPGSPEFSWDLWLIASYSPVLIIEPWAEFWLAGNVLEIIWKLCFILSAFFCIYMYIYMYIHLNICIYMYIHIRGYLYTYIYIYIYIYIYTYRNEFTCAYIYYICMHVLCLLALFWLSLALSFSRSLWIQPLHTCMHACNRRTHKIRIWRRRLRKRALHLCKRALNFRKYYTHHTCWQGSQRDMLQDTATAPTNPPKSPIYAPNCPVSAAKALFFPTHTHRILRSSLGRWCRSWRGWCRLGWWLWRC